MLLLMVAKLNMFTLLSDSNKTIDFMNLTNIPLRICLFLYRLNKIVITEPTRLNEYSSTLIGPCLVSYDGTVSVGFRNHGCK